MGKQVPKMSARVVNAIRNLREAHGSTSKEIMNYITSQYSASESIIQRQMQAALKRGLDYGILQKRNGHYFLNADTEIQPVPPNLVPVERSRRRKRRRGSRRRRRGRSRRSRRRRSRRRYRRREDDPKRICKCKCITKRDNKAPQQVLERSSTESVILDADGVRHGKSQDGSGSQSSMNTDRDILDDRQTIRDDD